MARRPTPLTQVLANEYNAHTIDLERYSAKVRREMRGFMMQLQDDLLARVNRFDENAPITRQRMETLIESADDTIKASYREARNHAHRRMRELAVMEGGFAVESINDILRVDLLSATLTPAQLRSIVSDVVIRGAPSAEWWGRQSARTRNAFADQVRMGMAAGETTGDIVRRVRGTSTGTTTVVEQGGRAVRRHVFTGGIMDAATRDAEALVRSSVQAVANDAHMHTFRANADVIKGVQAVVTFDLRTTQICIARAGAAWNLETGEPLPESTVREPFPGPPPWHWNCRTTLVPITYSFEELAERWGVDTKQGRKLDRAQAAQPMLRASMNGEMLASSTFDDFLQSLPIREQEELLGVGKLQLYRDGKLSLPELVDQTGRPLTLRELEQRTKRRRVRRRGSD
jgi:hypothetical protein